VERAVKDNRRMGDNDRMCGTDPQIRLYPL
jgi:hypothetical protein